MHRQPLHPASNLGQPTARAHGSQPFQQTEGRADSLRARYLEPLEPGRISSPRDDVEHRAGQIDPMNLGFAVWAQSITLIPQPADQARTRSSGTTSALISGVSRDPLGNEAVYR